MDTGGGVVSDPGAMEVFRKQLHESLVEGKRLQKAIDKKEAEVLKTEASRNRDLLPAPFPPRVDVYHELSLKRTIIEVQASDRLGLLYRLSRLIHSKGSTLPSRGLLLARSMDTFYIEYRKDTEQVGSDNLLDLRAEWKRSRGLILPVTTCAAGKLGLSLHYGTESDSRAIDSCVSTV